MTRFLALCRKEILSILLSSPMLLATAFIILLDSFAFYIIVARDIVTYAVFDDMAMFMLFTSILIFPLISMHSFSEENAGGTLETLLTAPIGNFTAVMAKFTGLMAYVGIYLLHGLVFAILLSYGGNLDWHATLAAFLALIMVGAIAMSLGVFVSSVTISPVAAATGTVGILIAMALAADMDPYAGTVSEILNSISFIPHARRWIAGEIDTRGIVYFVSVAALFLFYAWLAVGARGLERRAANQVTRHRLNVTYFLVVVAIVMFLLQTAYLHIKGFWEGTTPFGSGFVRVPWQWLLPTYVGFASLVWSIFTYRAARRSERIDRQQAGVRYATISETRVLGASRYYYEENVKRRRRPYLAALAALLLVLNLNWLAHYPFRTFSDSRFLSFLTAFQWKSWDVSWDKRNSLSGTTRKALDGLQGRLQIYNFLPVDAEIHGVSVGEDLRRLLTRYVGYNDLVGVLQADSLREPELAATLAGEIGMEAGDVADALVLDYQGRRLLVAAAALVAPPDRQTQAAGFATWFFSGESKVTQSVLSLSDPRVPLVLFTMGHGELTAGTGPRPDRSASRFVRNLIGINMTVQSHLISASSPIPPECDILVVAQPRVPFGEQEANEIRRFLDGGGRLLVLGPSATEEIVTVEDPLGELLFEIGGHCRDDILSDPDHNYGANALMPVGHIRDAGVDGLQFVFPFVRTIRDNPRTAENGWVSERLVESWESSFSQPVQGGAIRQGPFTLVYRASRAAGLGEARVVLVATGAVASDAAIVLGENEGLLTTLAGWLAGRGEAGEIAPRAWVDRRLKLVGPQMRAILWIGVVGLPFVWLLAGISVWWLRKE